MKIKGSRIAIAAVAVSAFGAASAASLGGLSSTSVGSNDVVVAACDSDGVAISYTTSYNAAASKYQVTGVTVSGIAPGCLTKSLAVTVKGTGGTSLGTGSATVAGTSEVMTLTTPANAQDILGASVLISG